MRISLNILNHLSTLTLYGLLILDCFGNLRWPDSLTSGNYAKISSLMGQFEYELGYTLVKDWYINHSDVNLTKSAKFDDSPDKVL